MDLTVGENLSQEISAIKQTGPVEKSVATRTNYTIVWMVVIVAFTYGLQMYSPVTAFGAMTDRFGLSLSDVTLLVSVYFLGYAIAHIPSGIAAAAYGLKQITVLGSFVVALSSFAIAIAPNFATLLVARALGGVGMSLIVASAIPLAVGWTRPDRVRMMVGGLVNGLGFTLGAAVGLYLWTPLTDAVGWRASIVAGAVLGVIVSSLAVIILKTPSNSSGVDREEFSWASTRRCLRSRSMWGIGIASVGAYGALTTVSQIGPSFAESELGFSTSNAALASALLLFIAIPGAMFGGYVADRSPRYLPILVIPVVALVILVVVLPYSNDVSLWFVLGAIGFAAMWFFAPITVSPGEYPDEVDPRDFGTALGLVLTLGNVGAVACPYLYGLMTQAHGATAGWWAVAGVIAVGLVGLFLAREPRHGLLSA